MKTLFLLAGLSISLGAFAQKEYFNENYKLQKQEVKLAFIPFLTSDILFTETITESLIQYNLKKVILADVETVSKNILTDSSLNESIRKVITKEYMRRELKNKPNLLQIISTDALTNMQRMLDTADILLIPSKVKYRSVERVDGTGNTTVYGRFRLYDLNTGEFIFDYPAEKKVQYLIAKNEIRMLMSVLLEDFNSYFQKNFITRNNLGNN